MANIMKGLSAFRKDKCRLLKVGSVTLKYGVNAGNNSATLNISSVYEDYKNLSVDDICFPVTRSYAWQENYPNSDTTATLSNFTKSYNADTGVITIKATGSKNYNNTQITCDVYILDRVGGGVINSFIGLLRCSFHTMKGVF